MKWKLVPGEPTKEQREAGHNERLGMQLTSVSHIYRAMLAAAPIPEHDRMTKEEAQAKQDWKGMDGAT